MLVSLFSRPLHLEVSVWSYDYVDMFEKQPYFEEWPRYSTLTRVDHMCTPTLVYLSSAC